MMWSLPLSVNIDGKDFAIRNKCDYRVVLDVICALNDEDLEMQYRIKCALLIFYDDLTDCQNFDLAVKEMLKIINNGQEETDEEQNQHKPKMMDWEHDFPNLSPPISRVLGYSVRDPEKYTHWYDFLGAYMEIGECAFSTIVSIRNKKQKGKKLEKWEQEFYKENKKMVDLPRKLTEDERDWLDSDW